MKNILLISVFLFLTLYGSIILFKPTLIYKEDGTIREFGVGYRNKTVTPLWFVSILLAILSYISIRYYALYMS
jgi:hypothetical protein